MRAVVVALVAFAVMEPVTAATHRFVMHGFGAALHRSHHRPTHDGWERNDAYPVMFAVLVCVGLWVGFHDRSLAALVPIGAGITAYGAAYAVVHDVYIHRRLRWFGGRRVAVLDRLAAAHELHHRFGGAPYGMLLPLARAAVRARDSAGEGIAAVPRS
jgi:beta-carotene 3-hydroxylase